MTKSNLDEKIKKLEVALELVKRLEKLGEEFGDLFGECGFMEYLEDELKAEVPYAERDRIGLTGNSTEIGWSFEEIVDQWNEVYEEENEESRAALHTMGEQFCKLGEMFKASAAIIGHALTSRSSDPGGSGS